MSGLMSYKNFEDVMKDLNCCADNIYKDEEYHWWTGVIDCCRFCGIISIDEKNALLKRLEKIYTYVKLK